jgi:hypothetical protein
MYQRKEYDFSWDSNAEQFQNWHAGEQEMQWSD